MSEPGAARPDAARARISFILNPVSGRLSSRARRRERIEAFVRRHGLDATIEMTRAPGHATALAKAALKGGARLVVSVGGDGTMNEVAQALVGADAVLGMIPTGSGNGLGRELGLPMNFDRALDMLLTGAPRTIDTGVVNGLPFFNLMGLGFDAEISRRFVACQRRGLVSYLGIGCRTYFGFQLETLRVERNGSAAENVRAFVATVANSRQYGNNARIAPAARLDDGELNLTAITTSRPLEIARLTTRLFAGTLRPSASVHMAQASRFRIVRAAAGPVHTDGEVHECDAVLEIATRPRSLRVLAAAG